jgi:hypothetical protein
MENYQEVIKMRIFFLLCCLFWASGQSKTTTIHFGGGKIADTLSLFMGYPNFESVTLDTLSFFTTQNDSLKIFTFFEYEINAFCNGPRHRTGLSYGAGKGAIGRIGAADSIWKSGEAFPDSLIKLDSVLLDRTWFPGVNLAESENISQICTLPTFHLLNGYHQIVYFKARGIFGKIQISLAVDTTVLLFANPTHRFDRIVIRYLFSDNKNDMSDPAIGIKQPKSKKSWLRQFSFLSFRDFLGRIK